MLCSSVYRMPMKYILMIVPKKRKHSVNSIRPRLSSTPQEITSDDVQLYPPAYVEQRGGTETTIPSPDSRMSMNRILISIHNNDDAQRQLYLVQALRHSQDVLPDDAATAPSSLCRTTKN